MFLLRASLLLLSIAVALFFAFRTPRSQRLFFRLLRWQLVLAFAVELFGIISREYAVRNVWAYNIYAIIEFGLLLRMVYDLFPGRLPVLLGVGTFGGSGMAYSLLTGGLMDYLLIEGLLAISLGLSLLFLLVLWDLARTTPEPLHRLPYFWFFSGGLLYFGGIIPVLGTWKFMGQLSADLAQFTYWIVVLMAILRYSLTAVACALARGTH